MPSTIGYRTALGLLLSTCAITAFAQTAPQSLTFTTAAQLTPLLNGLELRDTAATLRITALRDDLLRIRIAPAGQLPEDSSWAVLPASRTASVKVMPELNGFSTTTAHVSIDRATGKLTVTALDGRILQEDALPLEFRPDGSFRLTETMPADAHFYGLGDKAGPMDRRGRTFTMWNTDAYHWQESTDPLYKDIPFFLTFRAGNATGTFLDNTWRSTFDFGQQNPNQYSFGAAKGPVDLYLMLGPTPRDVVEAYAWLTGKPPLPPRWTLGFQQSRFSYMTAGRVLEVASRFRADYIPADAIYLDIDYQQKYRPFTVDTKAFPDLQGTIATLRAMNFHTVAITDLHIAKAPGENYAPYDSGTKEDRFLHAADGSVFSGPVWPGPSVFPDFTQAGTRAWWGGLYQPFLKTGLEGFWNDMNEPSVFQSANLTMPEDTQHRIAEPGFAPRTATHAEIHNVYGMLNSQATYEGLLHDQPGTRPFVLTRASYAGGQRYAATWTGDNSSTWNHLRMTGPMLKSLGLAGFSFAGADVGGYAGTPSTELLTRWLEVAAFHPIDRDHTEKGTADQEPWVGGPAAEATRRRYIEERYRLMPYLYTLAEETARTGLPMMRPLFLDFPEATRDRHPIDNDPGVDAEFLLGHDLLIAPSPFPDTLDAYTVEFPSSTWYDYWTGKQITVPTAKQVSAESAAPPPSTLSLTQQVTPTLETLPVYVRGGAILPIAPVTQSTNETPQGPLTLRVYAGDDCRGTLYTDDGKTFAYRKGDFLRENFTCNIQGSAMTITVSPREGKYPAWWHDFRIQVFGKAATKAALQGSKTKDLSLTHEGESVAITVPDNGRGLTLRLE